MGRGAFVVLYQREWSGLGRGGQKRWGRVKLRPAGSFTAKTGWCYRLMKTCKNKVSVVKSKEMRRFSWIKAAGGELPAHSLHHVCDKAVRDARTGLLCQIEGVFQLLNGPDATATRPPLLLQLDKSNTKDFVSCAMQNHPAGYNRMFSNSWSILQI